MYLQYNMTVEYQFDYSEEKDFVLLETRGVCFKDVIRAISQGFLLDDIDHFNKKKYPDQRIFIVRIQNMIYVVPYIFDEARSVVFLKTIYPSRVLKKKYLN